MAYLLDTNHCIYFLNGLEKRPERRKPEESEVIRNISALPDPVGFFSEVVKLYTYFLG